MQFSDVNIPGIKVIQLKIFRDNRGFFVERFKENVFREAGLPSLFVQDNHSRSVAGVLRGLHYQFDLPQGKLVGCIRGRIWDVAVDLRSDSNTYGQHFGIELNSENGLLLWIPAGFAHGFCVLGDEDADVIYKVDNLYNGKGESAIHWNDPELAISWPVKNPLLSPKDEQAGSFADYRNSELAKRRWWL